jgi:manganese/iron transport system permease protein
MMGIAALVAVVSGVSGLYVSFYANVSSGAAIVLICTGFFGFAWIVQAVRHRRSPHETEDEAVFIT